jgi:hypothetical protein
MKQAGAIDVTKRLCRRYPPTVQAILIPQGPGAISMNLLNNYPTVDADDQGCGEFTERTVTGAVSLLPAA